MNSVSIKVAPHDSRCRYWAKFIAGPTTLKLPSEVDRAADLPGAFFRKAKMRCRPATS